MRWADQGNGERSISFLSSNTIFDIEPYGQDGVVFANGQPALNIFSGGEIIMAITPATAGMGAGSKGSVTTNPDATQVRFAFDYGVTKPVMFDLNTLELKDMAGIEDTLKGADTTSLPITKYNTFATPELNGTPLEFETTEVSHSATVADDKSKFAIGSSWYIRQYDKDGKHLWRSPITGSAWGVAYAQDDKVIVAAIGDGTIRWFAPVTALSFLSLFVHTQDNRWVLWTPKGYYAASAGGEDLIGWIVNRGETEAPDFFPASQLPRMLSIAPTSCKRSWSPRRGQAVKEANADCRPQDDTAEEGVRGILPPVVELAMDSDEINTASSPVEVKYKVRSPNGEPIEFDRNPDRWPPARGARRDADPRS